MERKSYYWIAVNGPSVAMLTVPARADRGHAIPSPEQLFGFPTAKEAAAAQRFLLTAPMPQVNARIRSWGNRIKSGEMAYIRPANPQPPTGGETAWVV
jgi:hypothetical protein